MPAALALAAAALALAPSTPRIVSSRPVALETAADGCRAEEIVYLSDGLRIRGYVVTPKAAAGALPAIVYNRGGNRDFGKIDRRELAYLARLCAAGPYVVAASQLRGSAGSEGKDEFGGGDVDDVLNLLALLGQRRDVDASRVAMLGFSRGGLMTYLAIRRGARIGAAAVVGAPADLAALHRDRAPAMKRVLEETVGASPEADPGAYAARSALEWPEALDVPLLMLQGEHDEQVDAGQSLALAARLEERGLPHRLVVFPGARHSLEKSSAERDRLILDWFRQWLAATGEAR